MKITYFTDTFLPQINGVVTSLLTVASGLADQGHHIQIYAPKPKRGQKINWSHKNITVEFLPSMPVLIYEDLRLSWPLFPGLIKKIKKFDPDVIHFQTSFLVGGGGILLGKMLKKPIIGSFHGYFMEPEYLRIIGIKTKSEFITSSLWKYAALFYNLCDVVLTPANTVKTDLIKHGIKKPIHVIANSIQENNISKVHSKEIQELKERYALKENVILYVGRISHEKCLDVLLKSFVHVLKECPETSLFIIGHGPIKKQLESLAKSLKIHKSIIFTGAIKQDILLTKGYYQVADMFSTASTSEVQPVSIIEALYFGLPIVGVSKRGVEEMVKDVGLLSKPSNPKAFAEHMINILSNKNLHDELSKKSLKEYHQKYSISNVTQQYVDLYKNIITAHSSS